MLLYGRNFLHVSYGFSRACVCVDRKTRDIWIRDCLTVQHQTGVVNSGGRRDQDIRTIGTWDRTRDALSQIHPQLVG